MSTGPALPTGTVTMLFTDIEGSTRLLKQLGERYSAVLADQARGRIGLKLVQKHENGGFVSPEELVERAKDAPPRPPSEDRPRRDSGRGGRGGPRRDREGARSE